MLLRISFLEPTYDRSEFYLKYGGPDALIVLPRISFTGDGKTDNVTVAWFLWGRSDEMKTYIRQHFDPIIIAPKFRPERLHKTK